MPENLYEFLLRHIQITLLWGFIFNLFIIRRFKIAGIGFVIVYELAKYYLFGYRFLAESYIVYPMVYMAGLIMYKLQGKEIYRIEYVISGIFTWFVVFSRETFIPAAVLQFALLVGVPRENYKKISIAIFVLLSALSLVTLPIREYLFSIGTVSYEAVLKNEASSSSFFGLGILKSFFYPVFILFEGKWNELRILLIGFSVVFIITSIKFLAARNYKMILVIFLILGISNIRAVEVGTTYYQAFRMIPWFGIFILTVFLLLENMDNKIRNLKKSLYVLLIASFLIYFFHPQNFRREQIDSHKELITNYGETIKLGEVVKILSDDNQTLFINQNDSLNLAYWQSGLNSPYQYGMYGYLQPGFDKYKKARDEMIKNNPPDFYHGDLNIIASKKEQKIIDETYENIYQDTETSALYIKKSLIRQISEEKWQKVKIFNVTKSKGALP